MPRYRFDLADLKAVADEGGQLPDGAIIARWRERNGRS
jgi:hypothetical protein